MNGQYFWDISKWYTGFKIKKKKKYIYIYIYWWELPILNDIKSSKFVRKQLLRTSFGLDPK